jgi:N-glycosylase/DNA lyase
MVTGGAVWSFEVPLKGAGGEPIDLARTIMSHGLAELPPMRLDEDTPSLEATIPVPGRRPRTVRIASGSDGFARISVAGRRPGRASAAALEAAAGRLLRVEDDLAPFYDLARDDPDLAWVTKGAGRMLRGSSAFEDVVKTICTTNCSWTLTTRMVTALVENLGDRAPGSPPQGHEGRAFPRPESMAEADAGFYRDVVRAGYRGPYLKALARSVADGSVDLEAMATASPADLPNDELDSRLQALPGVGPYASAHIMMLMGRYSRLILDAWTRPTYARLVGRRAVKDSTIERRFRRYGPYAGLAFWLFLTRDWIEDADRVAPIP